MLLDLEIKQGKENREQVRRTFERVLTTTKLKAKQAKSFFKRWLEYEQQEGDPKSQERVEMKAAEYVKKLVAEKSQD